MKPLKGFKFVESLKVDFSKVSNDETVYKNAYFDTITQTIVNENEIHEALRKSKQDV